MRVAIVLLALFVVGCSGDSPSAPTPPPVPVIQNAQGRWTGDYSITGCTSTSQASIICTEFNAGRVLPMVVTLTQSGTTINGTLELGSFVVTVSGFASSSGVTLNGTGALVSGGTAFQVAVNGWQSSVAGTNMSGTWTTTLSASGLTGTATLSNAIRVLVRTT